MYKEYVGQFPSQNCHCHIQKPHGFVPEAGCPEHDTEQFVQFLKQIKKLEGTYFTKKAGGVIGRRNTSLSG